MAATPRSAPRYKLYYFNMLGRAEVIRMLFKAAGVQFQDVRITQEQWKEMKPKTPYGGLPVLETEGRQFGETQAILRWAARKFGMSGKCDSDELVVEAVLSQAFELMDIYIASLFCKDEAEKEKMLDKFKEKVHEFFTRWEGLAKDSKSSNRTYTYVVGTSMTVADLVMFRLLEDLEKRDDFDLSKYKKLQNLKTTVANIPQIRDHLATRPA